MNTHSSGRGLRRVARCLSVGIAAACGLTCLSLSANAQVVKTLPAHTSPIIQKSVPLGRVPAQQTITLALTLPLRNQAQLKALVKSLYDSNDPLYGQYLTSQDFADQFGPTQADYDAVAAYATAQGFTIKERTPNRTILDVTAPARAVESAFGLKMQQYRSPEGRVFFSPDSAVKLPAAVADKVQGVVGLDSSALIKPHMRPKPTAPLAFLTKQNPPLPDFIPHAGPGSGPGGDLTPTDIRAAYNLTSLYTLPTPINGSGQILGLFELDGYNASDVALYEQAYNLPNVPLQNVYVDGYNGAAGFGEGEVILDIEMMIALCPNINKIVVYEAPNSFAGLVDCYNKIATQNIAKSVSTSWGVPEIYADPATLTQENAIFLQMAVQGQSIYDASGDNGAYDDGTNLCVDDPASQPYMTGVGGTHITTNGPGGTWLSETTWHENQTIPFDGYNDGGSGGGISQVWPITDSQAPLMVRPTNGGSSTMRNVPDVSFNADYNRSPFSIYLDGFEQGNGGTSAAAPLWAAFTALVNQARAAAGKSTVGLATPALYAIAQSPRYTQDFHDIADGSNNLKYTAVTGYDLATGLGSFNGVNLFTDLVNATIVPIKPPTELMGNGGFENGAGHPQPWNASLGIINSNGKEPAFDGKWKAWLCGYGAPHTDSLYQSVTIPANIRSPKLSFGLLVDANPNYVFFAVDRLNLQIRSSAGKTLRPLATYYNSDDTGGAYQVHTFDMSAYKGQTIQVYLSGNETGQVGATSFVLDHFSLSGQLP